MLQTHTHRVCGYVKRKKKRQTEVALRARTERTNVRCTASAACVKCIIPAGEAASLHQPGPLSLQYDATHEEACTRRARCTACACAAYVKRASSLLAFPSPWVHPPIAQRPLRERCIEIRRDCPFVRDIFNYSFALSEIKLTEMD